MKKLLSLLVVSSLLFAAAPLAYSQNKTEIKQKKNTLSRALSRVKDKRDQVRTKLKQKEAESQKMMGEIHWVDRQMEQLETTIAKNNEELAASKKRQEQLSAELQKATDKLDSVRQQASKRVRRMYTTGEKSALTALVTTDSIGDIAVRKNLLKRVADQDRKVFAEVKVLRDEVLAKKKEEDRVVAKIGELTKQKAAQLQEFESIRQKKKDIFSILKAEEGALERQFREMQYESNRIASEVSRLQAKLTGQVPVFSGRFIQPVSGRRSSGYGMRRHPISGRTRMHTGVDIAAPSGTAIKAAGAGRVISAGYRNGYGNTVVIDHGGGISTLYAHCSRIYVSVGKDVKQGDRIAAVGSTGYSTGPHLHFEVRKNGKPVDPGGRF